MGKRICAEEIMVRKRCPGMDPAFFKLDDIQLHSCLECDNELEFWKDDVRLTCPKCDHVNFNPTIGNPCLAWCKEAAKCIGNDDIKKWLAENKDK